TRRAPRCRRRTTSSPCFAEPDVRRHPESAPQAANDGRTIRESKRSGAWRLLHLECGVRTGRWQLARLDRDDAVLNLDRVFEQSSFRRPRCARAVTVVRPAVAGAHEETRLWKPANRTTQMSAVHCKDLELVPFDAPHPAGGVRCRSVRWCLVRIPERCQP